MLTKTEKQQNHWSLFTLTLALSASLSAQTTTAPQTPPFERVDEALAAAAKDPLGADGLRYATSLVSQLGGSRDDSFAVINAQRDDKVLKLGSGDTNDWYYVELGPMEQVAVRLESFALADYDIRLYQLQGTNLTEIDHSIKPMGYADTVLHLQPNLLQDKHMYFIKVNRYSAMTPATQYLMRVDFSGYRSDGK